MGRAVLLSLVAALASVATGAIARADAFAHPGFLAVRYWTIVLSDGSEDLGWTPGATVARSRVASEPA